MTYGLLDQLEIGLTTRCCSSTTTGDPANQLGSGIADYWLNVVFKCLLFRTPLRFRI
jgi:hypothetical protein